VSERNYGFPQEFAHFVDRVVNDEQPLVTGEDGRLAMEVICAAHESAGTGRRIEWPYAAPRDRTPVQVWGR
jgi:myo-inositol 2-dehydrogenase/D-chiro-inositol 1-dehydrogenase